MSFSPPISLVDTHCHLNLDEFNADRDQVLERARKAGVGKILIPGIDIETSRSAINYARQQVGIYAAVGVHPNSGTAWDDRTLAALKQLAKRTDVVAIGEIGLDYYRDYTPKKLQQDIFIHQLQLAAELGLPVIIHNRDASGPIIEILSDWYHGLVDGGSSLSGRPGVLHSFSADETVARQVIEMHFKIGITGPVTFHNARSLQALVVSLPLDCIVIETDAPYLAPHPHRGKRNEPANVRIVAEKIAELTQLPFAQVAKVTTDTADRLFDWSVIH